MKLQCISTIIILATTLTACSSSPVTQNPKSTEKGTIMTENNNANQSSTLLQI